MPYKIIGLMIAIAGLFLWPAGTVAQLPELDFKSIAEYRAAIEPTESESAFLNIGWYSQLHQAVKQAHRTEKPLMIYVMNGHPLGCT